MNVSEELIRDIVKKVLAESATGAIKSVNDEGFVKQKAKSGIMKIATDTVRCEPFEKPGVALKDVTTLDEAPNMGAGVMELDHASLEWTLTYDEYDIVLDGILEIETNGDVLSAKPGEIIYIPAGSHIHFQTPTTARYIYIAYPANWADLIEK